MCPNYKKWLGFLIDHGFDVETADDEGRPPFMQMLGSFLPYARAAANYLIERGVRIDATTRNGDTALMCPFMSLETLELLLDRGICTTRVNNRGESALVLYAPKSACFQLCLVYGAEWLDHYTVDRFRSITYESLICLAALGQEFYLQIEGRKKVLISDRCKACWYPLDGELYFRKAVLAKRSEITIQRWRVIRRQALKMCIGLQMLRIPALQMVHIIEEAFVYSSLIPFHYMWNLVVAVKHFHDRQQATK